MEAWPARSRAARSAAPASVRASGTRRSAGSVTLYRAVGSARLLREPESLDGEAVLSGFLLPVAELFR